MSKRLVMGTKIVCSLLETALHPKYNQRFNQLDLTELVKDAYKLTDELLKQENE